MLVTRRYLWTRIALGGVLALLVWAGPSSRARAGCSFPHASADLGAAHLDRLALGGALTLPEGTTPRVPISPCAGLKCSSDPASPVPATPAASPRSEQGACVLPTPLAHSAGLCSLAEEDPAGHSLRLGLSLFRPPR